MRKVILTLLALFVLSVRPAFAANLNVKLEQPKTPSRINNFTLNFVALDTMNNPVTVKCYKQGPSDGSFTQFGSDFNLSNGGNTDNCPVDGGVVNSDGSYQFKVTASNGSETIDSNVVTVVYQTGGPSTPVAYSKEQLNTCTWKIHFTTASDNGKTVRVEVYRSDNPSFNADSGNLFANVSIGSGQNGDASITVPDCNKTWYFAVRAFDNADNGSGVIGDSQSTTVTNTTTTTSTTNNPGAIALANGKNGTLGQEPKTGDNNPTATPTEGSNNGSQGQVKGASTTNHNSLYLKILLGLTIIFLVYVFFFKKNKSQA